MQMVRAQEPSMDSIIFEQKKTILLSHTQLSNMLRVKYIQNRYPRDYAKIIKLKHKSYDLIVKIDQTPDLMQKFELLKVSISTFNKAQLKYNALLTKKRTQ
jgi:hypothetical protein